MGRPRGRPRRIFTDRRRSRRRRLRIALVGIVLFAVALGVFASCTEGRWR